MKRVNQIERKTEKNFKLEDWKLQVAVLPCGIDRK